MVLVFLWAPVLLLAAFSFNDSKLNVVWQGFTLTWYAELGRDVADHLGGARRVPLVAALGNSLLIAAATTAIATVLGTGGAWLLRRWRWPAARLLSVLILVPLAIPEVVMGVGFLILFSAAGVGLGFGTVIVAHVTFCFPFVLAAVDARLAALDPALEEAALDLGATPARAFFAVVVPALAPAILAGALLAFTLSLDELIVTWFTRGPTSATLPIQVFGMAKVGLNPVLNALSTVFVAATAAAVIAAERLRRPRIPEAA